MDARQDAAARRRRFFPQPAKLALLATALAVCGSPAAQQAARPQPISLDAESGALDRNTELIEFRAPTIRQGDLVLAADRALGTGYGFEDSEWQFIGNVRITFGTTVLESDAATFTFLHQQLTKAELRGAPASFVDNDPSREENARGGANTLSYDHALATVRMSDNAWLSMGPNEIRGCDLIYDFAQGQVTSGSSDCGERFSITILPPEDVLTDSVTP